MLASIYELSAESWTINSLINRDADVEIEDDPDEDKQEEELDDDKQPGNTDSEGKGSLYAFTPDIFTEGRENLSMNDCFN